MIKKKRNVNTENELKHTINNNNNKSTLTHIRKKYVVKELILKFGRMMTLPKLSMF